jgi:Zn-dependent protease with chaperone function
VSGAFAIWATREQLSVVRSLVAGAAVVVLAIGGAPWLGRALRVVTRAPPRLEAALSRAQALVGDGVRTRLLVLPIASVNAFAFQLTRTIGVTRGALEHLSDAELEAVLAHELGHLREPAAVVLLRTLVAVSIPLALVILPTVLRLGGEWAWLAPWPFVLVVLVLFRQVQRALERRADAVAHGVSAAYAAALETVYRTNATPAVLGRSAMHPDLLDRMAAAGVTPEWPRPRPVPSIRALIALLVVLAAAAFAGGEYLRSTLARVQDDDRVGLTLLLAMEGRPYDAGRLALWHFENGDDSGALALFRAAEAMDEDDPTWPAWVVNVASHQGRCEDAADASRRLTSKDPASPWVRAAESRVAACKASRE